MEKFGSRIRNKHPGSAKLFTIIIKTVVTIALVVSVI
jgi:hypothetical protein